MNLWFPALAMNVLRLGVVGLRSSVTVVDSGEPTVCGVVMCCDRW